MISENYLQLKKKNTEEEFGRGELLYFFKHNLAGLHAKCVTSLDNIANVTRLHKLQNLNCLEFTDETDIEIKIKRNSVRNISKNDLAGCRAG